MGKILMILEVSQKQNYIFSSKLLRENAARSEDIAYVTSPDFFRTVANGLYTDENLVYSGGGHTVLQFEDSQNAGAFAIAVTTAVLQQFEGMELFVKQHPYDDEKTPGENLLRLSEALEAKKARRKASFRQLSLGIEQQETGMIQRADRPDRIRPPEGRRFPNSLEVLSNKESFLAVVHIDGNAMGKRVKQIYDRETRWDSCRTALQAFSDGIKQDFETAFYKTAEYVAAHVDTKDLPIRPVVLAGDDVCFVTAGSLGLECARVFLETLAATSQSVPRCAACAGVALIHLKYPFHRAYALAEELCDNAKKFGAALQDDGQISAMDWHLEFGQLQGDLNQIRKDYITEDQKNLTLRPVAVVAPKGAALIPEIRTYNFFRNRCKEIQKNAERIARSKMKELRTAMKQGAVESAFFLHNQQISKLLNFPNADRLPFIRISGGKVPSAFVNTPSGDSCILFDAIELSDHCTFWEEAKVCR